MIKKNNIEKNYINKLTKTLQQNKSKEISALYNAILDTWKKNKTIFICGNGGSAANSNHIANDLSIAAVKNSIVDINILLNRVKIKENDEKKQKLFFLGSAVLILSVMTLFLYLLK